MPNCNNLSHPEPVSLAWLDDDSQDAAESETKVLSLANVAEMFGVSTILLRYYELRGLIERRNRVGRQRVYSWADCERLALIIKCRKVGVRLRDVVSIIRAADDDAPADVAKDGQEKCMALVLRLEQQRSALGGALSELSHIYALLNTKILAPSEPRRD